MGMLSVQDKVCILICWALTLMYSTAEREPVLQNRNLTWDEARNHCQVCFKDLITLSPTNIQTVAQNLTSDYWLGLRKNSSSNSSMPWTRWVNGDPLTFQNWYPGWPVFKSPIPKRDCCSCSCTCPETTTAVTTAVTTAMTTTTATFFTNPNTTDFFVTDFSGLGETTNDTTNTRGTETTFTTTPPIMTTAAPVLATCTRTPMMPPDEPETDQNFIEDSCVAMLSVGAWVERNCTERLPFICYEDPFLGPVFATNVSSKSASLTWLRGPPGIDLYRIEVKSHKTFTTNETVLTSYELGNLTEGTQYTVRVFPVKCERDLNPQMVVFYTPPNKVETLDAIKVTDTSVLLKWSKPMGNVDYYRIVLNNTIISNDTKTTEKKISNLTPGNKYAFSVISGLLDRSRWSEGCNITRYTKPGIVTNLRVSDNTKNSLLLEWNPPEGNLTGYRVTAVNGVVGLNKTLDVHQSLSLVRVRDLPMGTKIKLSVTAIANHSLEGDEVTEGGEVTVVNYTAPGQILNLKLVAGHGSINATWNPPNGSYSSFTVDLHLAGVTETTDNIKEPKIDFKSLKTAANYTVIVYTISGHIKSKQVNKYIFTLPEEPTDAKAYDNDTFWKVEWKAPANVATITYLVNLTSHFWGQNWHEEIVNSTSYEFHDLKSGTKYDFEVRTIAESILSNPAAVSFTTAADEEEISLSMMCSSEETLFCDSETTREKVFEQLELHFKKLLKDYVFWNLERVPKPGNT